MLKKAFSAFFFLAVIARLASAQEPVTRPLSPPERSPIPLTDADQQRPRPEVKLAPNPVRAGAAVVKIPGRHISSGNAEIDALVYEAAARYQLDPCLILSVMNVESGYNRLAVSPKGASGLMQLMPATAARFGVVKLFDARENVMAGARYLRWLMDRFGGSLALALAGYNAGEGAVEFYGYRIPPFLETQNYVRAISARYSRLHGDSAPISTAAPVAPVSAPVTEKIPTYNMIIRATSSDYAGKDDSVRN